MSSHLVFSEVDDAVKARLEAYWEKKLPRLQRLLAPYRTDLQEIRLTVYRHQQSPQRSWFEVRVVIELPTGTLAAEENDKDPQAALDRVVDKIVREIKRHKELVRHDYLYKRKSRRRADLNATTPMLQRDKDRNQRESFFRLLRPQLRFLRDQASRELRRLELAKLLHPGEVTLADVLDQVVALAWERFAERPKKMSLDLWLTDLLDEVLEQIVKQEPRPHVSLEERIDQVMQEGKARKKEEPEWWEELLGEEERLTLEDVLPDSHATEAWEELDSQEQRDRLLSLLSELPEKQRQAFMLFALEDYNTNEIAILQDRPESEVKADIEAARRFLRERLTAEGHVQESGKRAAATAAGGR